MIHIVKSISLGILALLSVFSPIILGIYLIANYTQLFFILAILIIAYFIGSEEGV